MKTCRLLFATMSFTLTLCAAAQSRIQTDAAGSIVIGPYSYDASGNITMVGADTYEYDDVGRIRESAVGQSVQQRYTYDAFGNLIAIETPSARCIGGRDCGVTRPVVAATNRLAESDGGTAYDDAGNLVQLDSASYRYTYDAAGMLIATAGATPRRFLYTAADERVATRAAAQWTWTVRDLKGAALSTYTSADATSPAGAQWVEDYVYRGAALLASNLPQGRRHFHLDHLGSPRLITDDTRRQLGTHKYLPFGAELDLGLPEVPEELHKFTGHERDVTGDVHDLDYMHARFYAPAAGRFLSIDPGKFEYSAPQSLNRYSYVLNKPTTFTDPTGRVVEIGRACLDPKKTCRELMDLRNAVPPALRVFVQPQLHNGKVILNAALLNAGLSHGVSANFLALAQVARSQELVEFRSSVQLTMSQSMNGKIYTTSFAPLAPDGSGFRGETFIAPTTHPRHVNAVYINPFETDAQRAEDAGHELLGHMALYLAGRPWEHGALVFDPRLMAYVPSGPQDSIIAARQHEAAANAMLH
jgi:RHS repeat-associated protein